MKRFLFIFIALIAFPGLSQEYHFDTTEMMIPCQRLPDPVLYEPSDLITDKLACMENEIPLAYNKYTAGFINYFSIRKRSYIKTMLEREALYFPMFEKKLAEAKIPDELKYLAIVESGLNPRAQSNAGAAGLWQFISSTGKMMGLKIDHHFDERMDPIKSTDAACRYLTNLYNTFGDWRYAIAAYNCGPGNVRRAKRRSGYKSEFWEVYPYLPKETRGYVPQFMAIAYVMHYADDYNLFPDTIEYMPQTESYPINSYCNLDTFCSMLDFCFDDLIKLNRSIKRHYIPDSSGYWMTLPVDVGEKFLERDCEILDSCKRKATDHMNFVVKKYPGSTENKKRTIYKVRSGDYLGKIAQRYHVSVRDLRKWNRIKGNTIRVGQHLTIWKSPAYFANNSTKSTKTISVPIPDSKLYIVQPGDTLWDISRKFNNVSLEGLKKLNNLNSNDIKPGQKLILGS